MAALVQLLAFLFLLWPGAAEFPAGPGWEWVSSLAKMEGKEYGEVAGPLVKMCHNGGVFPEITPIEGWALSAEIEPLWQAEGEGTLALVYEEEVGVEGQAARAVIAFRGHVLDNLIDSCANELLSDSEEDMNSTLLEWCYGTYKASTFDYYTQAVAYTVRVLEVYEASSVLLSGTSLGGIVADLVAAGVSTNYYTALPVVSFMTPGRRGAMLSLGLSLSGLNYTTIINGANQWDPVVNLNRDQIGTVCLFPTEEPPICAACFANYTSPNHLHLDPANMPVACQECVALTHDSLLLVDLMLAGSNPTCHLMDHSLLPLAVA